MSAVKRVLLKVEIRPAGRKCTCSHNALHIIRKGEIRFVVKPPGIGGDKGYCATCAHAMLAVARKELDDLEEQLS